MTISRAAMFLLMAAGAAALASCSSPTYGTGVRSDVQLVEDVTNAIALAPPKREKIVYNPRPELVKPADKSALPPPQTDVVAGNAAWPESPEERKARIRSEADENANNPNYRPEVIASEAPGTTVASKRPLGGDVGRRAERFDRDGTTSVSGGTFKQNPLNIFASKETKRAQTNQKLAESQQTPPTRRYLSDPPVDYQEAAESAPVNDIGEDERAKEARRKKLLKANQKKGWFDWLPF